jgi:hypothetical protein
MVIDELKERWHVTVAVGGMGDIHDPNIVPFVTIRGIKYEKAKEHEWRREVIERNEQKWVLKNIRFNAFVWGDKRNIYYGNKVTSGKKNIAEIKQIVDNWTEFYDENAEAIENDAGSTTFITINKCSKCGAKNLPGYRVSMVDSSASICILCMLEGVSEWFK